VAGLNIARAGLAEVVDLRIGRALDTLARLESDGAAPFDLVFIDADKATTPEYFQWALRLTRRGSVIVVDNVVREGQIVDAASDDASVQGMRRFCEMLAGEPRVSATALQTVGSKGYDGFAVALVTSV
jgi:predicted O-methyltransferase YrrM